MTGAIPPAALPPAPRGVEASKRSDRAPSSAAKDERERAGFALALVAWLGRPERAVAALAPSHGEGGGEAHGGAAANEANPPAATTPALADPTAPGVTKFPELMPAPPGHPFAAPPKPPAVAAPLAPVATKPITVVAPAEPAPISPAWPQLVPVADPSGRPPVAAAPLAPLRMPVTQPLTPSGDGTGADPRERRGENGSAMLRAARRTGRVSGPTPSATAATSHASTPVTAVKFAELKPGEVTASRVPAPATDFEAPAMRAWETRLAGRSTPGDALVMKLEGDAGEAGSLKLQVRGESLVATLRTHDSDLAARLGRDLGELEQSLRERGIERTRIQVSGPQAGSSVTTESRREPGRDDTFPRRDERSQPRRDEDPRRGTRSHERNPR